MEIERIGILDDVLSEDYLELSDGVVVKSLKNLIEALEEMSDEDFGLHVYGNHNDFAEWVLEAYWDDDLTGKLLKIRDRKKMVVVLKKVLEKAEKKRYKKIGKVGRKRDILKEIGGLYE